ncbi:MAG TPA: hypothetical protein PKZ07_21210, partial [Sedimentisphaerales bacterium]|nr:hypothetical protein [Sedimentisphaerales bacterium]
PRIRRLFVHAIHKNWLYLPTVPDEEAIRRLTICRTNECGHLVTKDKNEYCGACGCPKWRLAELKTKLRFAQIRCPCDPPLW